MATLDISGALQAMVNSNTPQAMMERNMATAMFAGRVTDVVDQAISKFQQTAVDVVALEADGKLTGEQAQLIIEARQAQLENARRFSAGYFS